MPDDHCELAGSRDGGDMLTAAGTDPKEKSAQRTWRSRSGPGGLDEHAARMSAALLGNPSVISWSRSGLSDARVETEVADELLGSVETTRLADRRHDGKRHDHIDARDCHQPLDPVVPPEPSELERRTSSLNKKDFRGQ